MKIVEIRNVLRKDIPIYYRRLYSGVAVIELLNKKVDLNLEFMIELMPSGQVETNIFLKDTIDYPLVPLQKELKSFINDLDSNGKLPT